MTTDQAVTVADGSRREEISVRQYAAGLAAVALIALALRLAFPLADPPWQATVGVVWHDEGAWTHNARNRALFGAWELDQWNPMYLAPVFTGLEYLSFRVFGVGLWQARLVSELAGFLAVLLMAGAIRRSAGRAAGLAAAALLATNYVWVTWNRAALMEATMIGFMVAAFYAYVRAQRVPSWGLAAGAFAMLAFFTKAAAAFFLAALGLEALLALALAWRGSNETDPATRRAALMTLAGLIAAGLVALAVFVLPHWREFWFYNWQMSVTRKPVYTLRAFADRISWLPVVHDFFTRMWMVLLLATGAAVSLMGAWRKAGPAARLLTSWVVLGGVELLIHDVGNERRLVFLIPPLIGLASMVIGRDRRLLSPDLAGVSRGRLLWATPLGLYLCYVLAGSLARLAFLYEVRPSVRLSAALAVAAWVALVAAWPRAARWMCRVQWAPRLSAVLLLVILAGDLAQYGQWALARTSLNYAAMQEVGRLLPPGTLVHGKLANGLALENGIKPVFVGRQFGNYDDRLSRDDVRYLATYTQPALGYEGAVILDVIGASRWRIVRTFPVAETSGGHDVAAILEKIGPRFAPR